MQDDESDLFQQELTGVTPLETRTVQMQVRPKKPTENQLRRRLSATEQAQVDENILSTEYVDMLDPHDLICFKREGVQEGVYRKLRLGRYEIEAVLDLHRKSVKEARQEVFEFIRECSRLGVRTVMILHGKGVKSNPPAVIKSYVAKWLPEMREVLAYHSAQKHHGGAGALYVLIRKSESKKLENRLKHRKGRE